MKSVSIIGMGMGPYLVGVASDLLVADFGVHSLRYALCLAVLVNVWAACHYFVGARSLRGDLAYVESRQVPEESSPIAESAR